MYNASAPQASVNGRAQAVRNTKQFGKGALPSNSSSIFRDNKPEGALIDILMLTLARKIGTI